MAEVWTLVFASMPTMILLGLRHALDIDHITAIDNLVRLHDAGGKARWTGAGFSIGHMISVLAEMVFIIFVVGSITNASALSLWGGIVGAIALASIGAVNLYAMKKWGKTSSAVLAGKVLRSTGMTSPLSSALVAGMVFGLGFDTATQISAITLSTVASATMGIQTALILCGFFAIGMVPLDTLDSVALRSAFRRISSTNGFRFLSYGLSGAALIVAAAAIFDMMANRTILPEWVGPALAGGIIATSFGYSLVIRPKHAPRQEVSD